MDNPRLIHVGDIPEEESMRDVSGHSDKPNGGLWTSARQDDEHGCSWAVFMRNNQYTHHYPYERTSHAWEVVIKDTATWLHITDENIDKVLDEFGTRSKFRNSYSRYHGLDWNRLRCFYDVVYIPDWHIHSIFNMYDCATGFVTNWDAIEDVRKDKEVTAKVTKIVADILEAERLEWEEMMEDDDEQEDAA